MVVFGCPGTWRESPYHKNILKRLILNIIFNIIKEVATMRDISYKGKIPQD
jgi:hypothetical protein